MEPLIDRENLFLLYATFAGDIVRTAHASSLTPVQVLQIVDDEKWVEKLRPIIELKKSTRPGDFERAVNRALVFAQAHRLRLVVERVLSRIIKLSDEELRDHLSARDKMGSALKSFSFRSLADLASAMEKANAMTFLSLSDSAQDRNRRQEQETGDGAAGDLSVAIANAMADAGASQSPRAMLCDAQLEMAESARIEASKPIVIAPEPPSSPHDNDDH